MVEEKQLRPSNPEEMIRLSAKCELLPCYYCGGEGKLHKADTLGWVMLYIQCENCKAAAMQAGTKLAWGRPLFAKEEGMVIVSIEDAKERCALKWNFLPERLGDRKMEEITNRREWKEWTR